MSEPFDSYPVYVKMHEFQIRDVDYDAGLQLSKAMTAEDALRRFISGLLSRSVEVETDEEGVATCEFEGRRYSAVPVPSR